MQPQAQSDRILSICKLFSPIVFNSLGNLPHPGPIPTCSDIEIIALSLFQREVSNRPVYANYFESDSIHHASIHQPHE